MRILANALSDFTPEKEKKKQGFAFYRPATAVGARISSVSLLPIT